MSKRLQGLIAGVLIGTLLTSGMVYAKQITENIQAIYKDIKIYVDGVKIDPKDATGAAVEPFIYNGTTYLPVRAVGEAISKQVTWDGATSSVYLGEKPGEKQYLLDVCPPYEKTSGIGICLANEGKSFSMANKKYSDGITLKGSSSSQQGSDYALFNLDGKYSILECTVGHVDSNYVRKNISFIVDGKTVKQITLEPECMPEKISVPLNNGLQLKILYSHEGYYDKYAGLGNIIVK